MEARPKINNHPSKWFHVESVPETHIFSEQDRPGREQFDLCKTIPLIDLSRNDNGSQRLATVDRIIKASRELGFFQVINHGIPEKVTSEAVRVLKELFDTPVDEITKDAKETGWVYMNSESHSVNGVHLWRDNVKHTCHPLQESLQRWPQYPASYRSVMEAYILEIKKLSLTILEMISEGLGLDKGFLGEMSQVQFMTASNYPPCPDPSLTLGLLKHLDHNLITVLFQGSVGGLQVMSGDGEWIGVEALPNTFVVNIGTQLEIISNGNLRSAEHRVVTNSEEARTSIAMFINPSPECIIEPAKALIDDDSNPPHYKSSSFNDFVNANKPFGLFTDAVLGGATSLKTK